MSLSQSYSFSHSYSYSYKPQLRFSYSYLVKPESLTVQRFQRNGVANDFGRMAQVEAKNHLLSNYTRAGRSHQSVPPGPCKESGVFFGAGDSIGR